MPGIMSEGSYGDFVPRCVARPENLSWLPDAEYRRRFACSVSDTAGNNKL